MSKAADTIFSRLLLVDFGLSDFVVAFNIEQLIIRVFVLIAIEQIRKIPTAIYLSWQPKRFFGAVELNSRVMNIGDLFF